MSIPECGKRDTCKNYGKECNSCWQRSDIYNTHPCYKSKDLVEVVRCKDCKHNVANWQHDELNATDYTDITCDYFMTDGMGANDFCSYGERKGEGE